MSLAVIVGGQFGSEGKGKTTSHLCNERGYDISVRCGGPNSGHTVTINNEENVLQQVPSGVTNKETDLFLSAGCLIDPDILLDEIKEYGLSEERLKVDRNSVIIKDEYKKREEESSLKDRIGSTCSGTGVAVSKRVLRSEDVVLAKDHPKIKKYVTNVSRELREAQENNQDIVIEGTQGFGLSLYHSPYYPKATSRDTTASGFISEVGMSPLDVSEVIMVLRTFPIRVSGNSGKLKKEIDWKTIKKESGYPYEIREMTSVTKNERRVGRFDYEIVKKAVRVNQPTQIALMGLDYINYRNSKAESFEGLGGSSREFIDSLERETETEVTLIGIGNSSSDIIDRS